MAAPSEGFWQRRGAFGLYELLQSWWRHRISFLLSLIITISALALYYLVFLQEQRTPLFEFVERLELNTLDPRIVIVDIDQHSQEVLGRWPFPRTNFARMLDALHDDGAKVAGFDITFSKPELDRNSAALLALWAKLEERKKAGLAIDPWIAAEVKKLAVASDADKQFAEAIQRFGPVVLGNFFLYTDADIRGIDSVTLDEYANQLGFFAFPQVIGTRQGFQKEDRIRLIEEFAAAGLLPK